MKTNSKSFNIFLTVTRSPYFVLLVIAFCAFSYFFLDRQIATYMKFSLDRQINHLGEFITHFGKGTWYFISLASIFILAKFIFHNRRWAHISLFILLGISLSGAVSGVIKFILGRARPTLFFDPGHLYGFTFFKIKAAYISFPSGHSNLITAFMLGLCFVFTRFWPLFMLLALIISASRVIIASHYLSDMIAGMYLSILIVPWLYQKMFSSLLLQSGKTLADSPN